MRKHTQLRTKALGETTRITRSNETGKFMDQKKAPAKRKFNGVRREKAA